MDEIAQLMLDQDAAPAHTRRIKSRAVVDKLREIRDRKEAIMKVSSPLPRLPNLTLVSITRRLKRKRKDRCWVMVTISRREVGPLGAAEALRVKCDIKWLSGT